MGALRAMPRAMQARSPSDKPKRRVCETRSPAIFACVSVNGAASRMRLSASSHASSGLPPSLTSLVCTSARFTVLLVALLNSSGVRASEPGSLFNNASRTEASKTALLTLCRLAAFCDQFVSQRPAGFYVAPNAPLGLLEAPLQRRDPQFIFFDPQDDLVSGFDPECFAVGGGDYEAAILINARPGFRSICHTE